MTVKEKNSYLHYTKQWLYTLMLACIQVCGFPFPTFFAMRVKEKSVPVCFAPGILGLPSASAGLGIRRQLD